MSLKEYQQYNSEKPNATNTGLPISTSLVMGSGGWMQDLMLRNIIVNAKKYLYIKF